MTKLPEFPVFLFTVLSILVAIIAVSVAFYNIMRNDINHSRNDVNNIIEQKLNSDEFMNKLVSRLRPSLIFDQHKRIYADTGALEYLDDFEVVNEPWGDEGNKVQRLKELTIKSRKFLNIFPVLESLDEGFEITPERGPKNEIKYKLRDVQYIGGDLKVYRFRLEIIRPRD